MNDVRKALEAAADAIYRDMLPERDGLAMETDAELRAHYYRAGRAAVLAFLKAMPDRHWMGNLRYDTTLADLTAAIEKETKL